MPSMMCIQCSVEFPSDALYVKHKKSGHKLMDQATPLDAPPVPTPPPGVPTESMPSEEFMEAVKRIEDKDKTQASEGSAPSQHPSELPPTAPIILTYFYKGECPDHRVAIETLELDVENNHFCVAYCAVGKHQVQTKQVVKL